MVNYYVSGKIVFPSLKFVFVYANSLVPNEMPHDASFHLRYTDCQRTHLGVTSMQRAIRFYKTRLLI